MAVFDGHLERFAGRGPGAFRNYYGGASASGYHREMTENDHDCSSATCTVKGLCKTCMQNLGEAPSLRRELAQMRRAEAVGKQAVLKTLELCGSLTRIVNTPVADSALEEIDERLDWLRDHLNRFIVANAELAYLAVDLGAWKEAATGALHRSCIGCAGEAPHRKVGNVHLMEDTVEPCTADPVFRDAVAELVK